MNKPIELSVWVLGQDEPIVIDAENAKQAYDITKKLIKEARKPFDAYSTFQSDSRRVFINPRFITMVKSSVSLVVKDEDE